MTKLFMFSDEIQTGYILFKLNQSVHNGVCVDGIHFHLDIIVTLSNRCIVVHTCNNTLVSCKTVSLNYSITITPRAYLFALKYCHSILSVNTRQNYIKIINGQMSDRIWGTIYMSYLLCRHILD